MKKKILIIGPYPPPFGGVTSLTKDLIDHAKHDYDIDILVPMLPSRDGIKIYQKSIIKDVTNGFTRYSVSPFWSSIFFMKKFIKEIFRFIPLVSIGDKYLNYILFAHAQLSTCLGYALKKLAKRQSYDHVLVITFNYCGALPAIRRHFEAKTKISLMIFAEAYKTPMLYKKRHSYFEMILDLADNVYSSSDYCACSIKKILGIDRVVDTIYIGTETSEFEMNEDKELKKQLGIPDHAPVILALSRMNEEMGYDRILDIADDVLSKYEDAYFLMVGATGEFTSDVIEFCNNHSRAKYSINIPFDMKPSYYSIARVFIAPTMNIHACMGVSIKEAMAAGRAIVASSSGGIPEAIKHGQNGFLVGMEGNKANTSEMKTYIGKLIEDDSLVHQFSTQARIDAKRFFSNEIMYKSYKDLLDN